MTRQNRNFERPSEHEVGAERHHEAGREPSEWRHQRMEPEYDLDQTMTQPVTPVTGRQVVLVPGQPVEPVVEPAPVVEPSRARWARPRSQLRRPSWFWPGFAAGFLLLSALSCGGLVMATGLNRIDLADIQGAGVAWTPPAVTPTATPDAVDQSASETGGAFQLEETVRNITSSRVNIRQTPGHQGKPESDIVAQLQPGDTMQIAAGPTSADNLTWWLIHYQAGGGRIVEGWVAEATGSGVQILGR